jgi:Spy/CpxP family protein refolding chaperone
MKTKHKILAALLILVVFGLGAAAGVLGERYSVRRKYRRPAVERTHVPSLDAWSKELQLTPDQQEKIREIFKKNEERMKQYRTEGLAKLGEIRKMLKDELDAVFTPDQKKKMEEMIRKHEERWKNESNRKSPNRNDPRERRESDRQPPDRER